MNETLALAHVLFIGLLAAWIFTSAILIWWFIYTILGGQRDYPYDD